MSFILLFLWFLDNIYINMFTKNGKKDQILVKKAQKCGFLVKNMKFFHFFQSLLLT